MTDTPVSDKSSSKPAFHLAILAENQRLQVEFDVNELRVGEGQLSADGQPLLELPADGGDWSIRWQACDGHAAGWMLHNQGPSLRLGTGQRVDTGDRLTLTLPAQIVHRHYLLDISSAVAPVEWVEGLSVLEGSTDSTVPISLPSTALGHAPSAATLAHWFTALGRLQRQAFHSDDFFREAARCVIDPGGLDGCVVLQRQGFRWRVLSSEFPHPELGMGIVNELLQAVQQSHGVVFQESRVNLPTELLIQHPAAIGAPLFNQDGEINGVLYGMRAHHRGNQRRGIRPLEAFFVQQVADAVSAASIREQREAELTRKSLLLEQTFPPELIARLLDQPEFLLGQERNLTVLFCDLRGFSQICTRLTGPEIYDLLSHVMDYLTDRVRQHTGVVIDYFGDGLAAFWNAPLDQPNHAELACQTAQHILGDLDELNAAWESRIGSPLRLGMGIHSGKALVGNSGSRYRIKYGPRGQTVNTASRIEAATKHFQLPLIVSRDTATQLGASFRTRRICSARLPGIDQPVELHQPLTLQEYQQRLDEVQVYERALELFEQGAFGSCCSELTRFANRDPLTAGLHQTLLKQAQARRDGRFNRRQNDERLEFMALPENARNRE